jgi:hypothetical protein
MKKRKLERSEERSKIRKNLKRDRLSATIIPDVKFFGDKQIETTQDVHGGISTKFVDLEKEGVLTMTVYLIPHLDEWETLLFLKQRHNQFVKVSVKNCFGLANFRIESEIFSTTHLPVRVHFYKK